MWQRNAKRSGTGKDEEQIKEMDMLNRNTTEWGPGRIKHGGKTRKGARQEGHWMSNT